jgi:hypothetical protein
MIVARYIGYVLACQLYTLRLGLYWLHSALVFLSKPGARILVPVVLFAVVYLLRTPLDAAISNDIDTLWESLVRPIFGSDLANLTRPLNIELTAVTLLLLLGLVMLLLASMLQPVVGALNAPRKPLPPLPPMVVPNTEVKAVPATRLLTPQSYAPLPEGLASLSRGLPEELQGLLARKEDAGKAIPTDRFARPPAASPGSGAGQTVMPERAPGKPTEPDMPPRPRHPDQPPPPTQPPVKARPPGQRPKGPGSL